MQFAEIVREKKFSEIPDFSIFENKGYAGYFIKIPKVYKSPKSLVANKGYNSVWTGTSNYALLNGLCPRAVRPTEKVKWLHDAQFSVYSENDRKVKDLRAEDVFRKNNKDEFYLYLGGFYNLSGKKICWYDAISLDTGKLIVSYSLTNYDQSKEVVIAKCAMTKMEDSDEQN